VSPDGVQQPSAWRFPNPATKLLSLLGLRRFVDQSRGPHVRDVDWAPAAALLVRRDAAAAVDWQDSDEVEFCRGLHEAGWRVLYVPEARAVSHEAVAP
jgi:GT2 family glycosyltransferase